MTLASTRRTYRLLAAAALTGIFAAGAANAQTTAPKPTPAAPKPATAAAPPATPAVAPAATTPAPATTPASPAPTFTAPRPSPKATVMQTIGLTDFTVTYSRPGVKGRTIWGFIVPYDQPWRTGANEATTFTTSTDVAVAGQKLPAGTYSFFTIPAKDEWTVVFSKQKDLWGAYEYKPDQDALRVKIKPQVADQEEWMRFSFENLTVDSGDLVLQWEKLKLAVPLKVDVVDKVLADARTAIAAAKPDDWRILQRAADFCANNKINQAEAMTWAKKSLAVQENYYNLTTMAKLQANAGNTKEAATYAQKAIAAGKASKEAVDTAPAERLLAEWTGKTG